HLVDAAGDDPVGAWRVVRGELDSYGAGLADKPELIALSRTDLVEQEVLAKVAKALEKAARVKPFPISAPIGEGIEPLLDAIVRGLGREAEAEAASEPAGDWSPL
ncbi:MAG TPA: GTPase ObgE, partial [Sphingomicrobium sp.]|nr:GTPase ObgE [Sphingomicrobium sp.]